MEKPAKPGQQVLVALRRRIADGTIKPGDRIAEIPTAAALGVSRMPVRTALRTLEHEGLVEKLGARGYTPRAIDAAAITGAIEVRGVLEGLAVRRVTERGLTDAEQARLEAILAEGDAIFAKGHLEDGDLDGFYRYNLAFHDLLIAASGNPSICHALGRNNHLPFASAAALVLDWSDLEGEYRHLRAAHAEHRAVYAAMRSGDGARAEQLMRGHAAVAVANRRAFRMLAE